jgi:hypothetical protein
VKAVERMAGTDQSARPTEARGDDDFVTHVMGLDGGYTRQDVLQAMSAPLTDLILLRR